MPRSDMVTLLVEGGRKHKLRAGDILGALTGSGVIAGDAVCKIHVSELRAYVAVKRAVERKKSLVVAIPIHYSDYRKLF